ncbi:hypothetical protein FHR84_001749 [Actinopolyspora biskrensis]|uniref:DUF5666 domain-containing protein n=1 Tax=Actinopolyspora biskrensis TaxID=1470178 RepID=A0A852YT97_9ACTN|nr:hypothetical protein [Actinopolyspora biskrensis]NYH78424.1 hypothetical protein [Actinopolyspora biskrensis]
MKEEPENTTEIPREEAASGPASESGGERRTGGRNRTVAAVLIACGIAVVGGVVVFAATSGGSGGDSAMGGPGGGFQARGDGRGVGGAGGASALSDALHGEFAVRTGQGEYATRKLQTGDVTEVSAESLTVESDDGYSREYAVDSSTVVDGGDSTIDALSSGETVTVVAAQSGGSATASTVVREEADGGPARGGDAPGGGAGTGGSGND